MNIPLLIDLCNIHYSVESIHQNTESTDVFKRKSSEDISLYVDRTSPANAKSQQQLKCEGSSNIPFCVQELQTSDNTDLSPYDNKVAGSMHQLNHHLSESNHILSGSQPGLSSPAHETGDHTTIAHSGMTPGDAASDRSGRLMSLCSVWVWAGFTSSKSLMSRNYHS